MPALSNIEELRTLFEKIRDERNIYANTATRIGTAFLKLLEYLLDCPLYLRKDDNLVFEHLLTLLQGAVIGDGAITLNPDGSISCKSLRVDGNVVFNDLVFNRQDVIEGDVYFTDKGEIVDVSWNGDGQPVITFRYNNIQDAISFKQNDIVKCESKSIDANTVTVKNGYCRVESVDLATNSIVATLYNDSDVPGGKNYPPEVGGMAIRIGNVLDPARQNSLYFNAANGTFLFLQGVSSPMLADSNYAAWLGLPPDMECLRGLPVDRNQPYIYARGLIVRDIIKIDYQGNPVYQGRDCGQWDPTKKYIKGYDELWQGYYVDRVWWKGCLWQCAVDSCIGSEPRFNNTDWVCVLGVESFSIDIVSSEGDAFRAGTHWTTELRAIVKHGEAEIYENEIGLAYINWIRLSNDVDGDFAWKARHQKGTVGLTLPIDSDWDIPQPWEAASKVAFICEVEIGNNIYTQQYTII